MNTLRSEWTKLRSVRSTWIAVATAIFAGVALSILGASDLLDSSVADLPDDWDPTATSLKGFLFAQLIIGMLGALTITPEYATGMIGTSLTFTPARSRLLAAKAAVVAGVAFVTALVTTLASFAAVQLLLHNAELPAAGLGDSGVIRALFMAISYLTLVALIGFAIGTLARSTASSLAVLVGVLLLVPALAPGIIGDKTANLWPIIAGQNSYTTVRLDDMVPPTLGLVILAAAAGILILASHAVFRLRDV